MLPVSRILNGVYTSGQQKQVLNGTAAQGRSEMLTTNMFLLSFLGIPMQKSARSYEEACFFIPLSANKILKEENK